MRLHDWRQGDGWSLDMKILVKEAGEEGSAAIFGGKCVDLNLITYPK